MNEKQSSRPSLLRRMFRSWYVKGALIAVVVLAVIYAVAPRRMIKSIAVDMSDQWSEDEPLLKRTVVWQRAEPFEDPAAGLGADDSLVRPQFTEQGNVFYFTRRTPDGVLDIYRSERVQGEWQPAKPVKQLNSKAHDIGPVFRPDGKRLYLSSNRDGGQGGFDIYVSDLTEKGQWSKPKNLGPRVNSAAHEYDPAVSADDMRLFFASNRSPTMIERLAEGKEDEKRWDATLRADLGSNTFDLYMARRDAPGELWEPARPLNEINHPLAREGAPCVGPQGAFLYFISNRIERGEETADFDVYRAKIRGDRVCDMENLGSGVNWPGYDEFEPALSEEGYTLYFSSNRPVDARPGEKPEPTVQFTLYRSRAIEIFEESEWGRSKLGALMSFLQRNWWWVVTALLTLALLIALIWYLREVSLKRLPIPGFFLIALMVHILAGLTSFYVYFGEDIVREIVELKQMLVAEDVSPDNLHQSHEAGQKPYEKVADLKSLDTEKLSDPARQQTEIPNMPVRTETPIPQIPLEFQRDIPPDRLLAANPEIEPEEVIDPEFERRQLAMVMDEQRVEIEKTEAVEQIRRKRIEREQVDVEQRRVDVQLSELRLPRRRVMDAPKVARDDLTVERVAEQPVEVTVERPDMARAARGVVQPDAAPEVPTETVTAMAAPAAQRQPERAPVNVTRQTGAVSVPVPSAPPRRLHRAATQAAVPLKRESVEIESQLGADQPATAPIVQQPARLGRATPAAAEQVTLARVEIEEIQEAVGGLRPERAPEKVSVTVGRRQAAGEAAGTPGPKLVRHAVPVAGVQVAREEVPVERVAERPTSVGSPAAAGPAPAARSREAALPEADRVSIETISAGSPPVASSSATSTPVGGVRVALKRSEAHMLNVPVKTPGEFGGLHNPQNPKLIAGSFEKEAVDAPVSFSPRASRIIRRPARAPLLLYAEDAIGLRQMFRSRQDESKAELIMRYSGKTKEEATEQLKAIHRGLVWLADHQHPDGYWSFKKFYGEKGKSISGKGGVENNAGATGFALLPFLGDGKTHAEGEFQSSVGKGLQWLMEQQTKEGDFCPKAGNNTHMYSHAIAAIAMCEAYGMTRDPKLRDSAQRAIDLIVNAQNKKLGGWRYKPDSKDCDTSVVGWQVMALKSGQMAGLNVPQAPFPLVDKWLRSVEGQGENIGRFAYQGRNFTPTMTAEGLLCLQYLGADQNDKRLLAGADYLLEHLPSEKKKGNNNNSYYWYYGTQVMFHLGGQRWERWSDAQQDMLMRTQKTEGPESGTWDPKDQWENKGGRLFGTSLRVLMLEIDYRHLPLYEMRAEQGK